MKWSFVALHVGLLLIFGPVVLDIPVNRWIYYLMILVGIMLTAIAGYNAQARATGLGEPGEELLQQSWRWFRVNVLRQDVPPLVAPEPVDAHQSVAPMPPLSPLSKWVQGIGLVLVIAPTVLGWKVGNDWRMAFIAVGGVLIVLARRKLPPVHPSDPPHGQELLQAVWAWVQGVFKGQR
jgi:hypothetical protein